ncbi:MAG: hypothetical protein K0S28_790 [Paucimonas sp.]|jgi:hypothetical protein|nr:hypothetical protein [Paucimonas sp.]
MSSNETKPKLDELDLFLQREDDLSELLRGLPQPLPPSALDAAVLADAARAVERSRMPLPVAANDAVVPESARVKQPSFATRWRVPLGVAASIVIALPIFLLKVHAPIHPAPAQAQKPLEIVLLPARTAPQPGIDATADYPVLPRMAPVPAVPPPPIIISEKPSQSAETDTGEQARIRAMLAAIEEKLIAGNARSALEEWNAFRAVYPSHAVPIDLSERIRAAQEKN